MRSCFLHVGTPKTGSTTIQAYLNAARPELVARGLEAPTAPGLDVAETGRALARALTGERDPAEPRSKPWRWLDGHLAATSDDVCLSHEIFATALSDPARFAFVEAFFARRGAALTIVAYVRDAVGRINAAYTQHAKNLRMADAFESWAASISPETVAKFSPSKVFAPVVASDKVRFVARPFDVVRGELVKDFLHVVGHGGASREGFEAARALNASPGPKAVAAALAIRKGLDAKGVDQDGRAPYRIAYREALAARGWAEGAFFGFTPDAAASASARFADDYDAFAIDVWGKPWAQASPTRTRPRRVFDPETSPPEDSEEVDRLAQEVLSRGTPGVFAQALRRLRPRP